MIAHIDWGRVVGAGWLGQVGWGGSVQLVGAGWLGPDDWGRAVGESTEREHKVKTTWKHKVQTPSENTKSPSENPSHQVEAQVTKWKAKSPSENPSRQANTGTRS